MYAFFGRVELTHGRDGQVCRLLDFDNRLNPADSVHRDLSALGDGESAHLLLGYAIDDDDRAVIFNSDGLAAWGSATGRGIETLSTGSFLAFELGRDSIRLWTDAAANIPVFYYLSDELFLFSDSLMQIAAYLKHRVEIEVCADALIARGVTFNIATQLLSDRTPIDGVHMLLRDRILDVTMNGATAAKTLASKQRPTGIDLSPASIEKIGKSIALHSSVFVDAAPGRDFRFFLSGGVDSRIILGALRFSGVDMSMVNVRSNVHASRRPDLVVVEQLARRYGFQVNPRRGLRIDVIERNDRQAYEAWKACNLGVYDMLYLHHRIARNPFDQIVLTGNGGGIGRSVYGNRPAVEYMKKIAAPHRDSVAAELRRAAEECGVDFDDPAFLDRHYLNFRNSLHAGRSFYSVGCKVVPLSSPLLMELVARLPVDWKDRNVLHAALMCYFDPDLLDIPFDRNREPFAADGVELARGFLRSAGLDRDFHASSFRVYGERRLQTPVLESDEEEGVAGETILDVIEARLAACERALRSFGLFDGFEQSFRALEKSRDNDAGYLPETGQSFAKVSMLADLLG